MSSEIILKVEEVGKQYRLGLVGTGTISHDLNRWWNKAIGKEDPYLKVGEANDRKEKGNSDYVWALKNINFDVKRGEVLGIIGKNGAGKSTLLKILSRVTGPTTGQIKTKGRIASLLEVGTGFHPEMTGRENIYLNGAILGMTKAEISSKISEIIEFSGCLRYVDTPVKRYSSGMKVRLAFAVAAHLEPDILVVDEVLAVGDAEFQKKAIGKMQDISHSDGRTVLFVSHNMAAVKSLCTKAIVLEHGKVVFKGSQIEGVNYYLSNESEKQKIALDQRSDRVGNLKLKVVGINFLNSDDNEVFDVISGDFLKVKISIKKNEKVDFNRLFLAVNFLDEHMNYVASYVNDEMGFSFRELEDNNEFYLTIPHLYLRAGVFSLRILITENDTSRDNFVDLIENAAVINVLPADFWNSGKLNRKNSIALIPGSFSI